MKVKAVFLICVFTFLNFAHAETVFYTRLFSSVAIKGYDTVAYFEQKQAVKGSPKLSFKWGNVKWQFASQENLETFKANPEKYVPQYGGWCAYAMANGQKVGIDPKAFDIKEGKLYLNYSQKVQKKWRKKAEKYIPKADAFWKKI